MVLCSPLSAQHHKLGVTIGGVLSKPKNYQLFYGYHIGIKNEFTFCKKDNHIYLSPNLHFIKKGWEDDIYDFYSEKHKWKCKLYYIEIPLLIGYKHQIGNKSIFGEIGPHFSFGLFGNSKLNYDNGTFNSNVFSSDKYKRFDTGFYINLGLDFKKNQLQIGYSHSMQKPTKKEWGAINPQSRSIVISFIHYIIT